MENTHGDYFNIPCVAQTGSEAVPLTLGGIKIPFSKTETAIPGIFKAKVYITDTDTNKIAVPTANKYLTVMIWEEIA
jgi:hypothetical protein